MKKDIFEASFKTFDAATAHEIADNAIEGGRWSLYHFLSHIASDAAFKSYNYYTEYLSPLEIDILKARGFKVDILGKNNIVVRW